MKIKLLFLFSEPDKRGFVKLNGGEHLQETFELYFKAFLIERSKKDFVVQRTFVFPS